MSWLPEDFEHPLREDLPTGHHLRPIRGEDVDIDYPAVMGSRERLWAKYGEAWGWPAGTMSFEADREDLERHAEEIERHETFNYARSRRGRERRCSAASTSTRPTTARRRERTPCPPGGSSTAKPGRRSSGRSTSSCRAGSSSAGAFAPSTTRPR